MWLERFVIIAGSLSHDFLPHNWLPYTPQWLEISITAGALRFFLFWFFGFAKSVPTVAVSDVKDDLSREGREARGRAARRRDAARRRSRGDAGGVLAVFPAEDLLAALRQVRARGLHRLETYSPVRLPRPRRILGRGRSPVRYWTLIGALLGCAGGFCAGHRLGPGQQPDRRRQAPGLASSRTASSASRARS